VLRAELARRGVKRVLLVTASFHSRRSAIVFHLFCPGIQFISVPASDPYYHPDTWWMDASSQRPILFRMGQDNGHPGDRIPEVLP
jgi:uncharacterized SAM-binding protein YcdF (DUF218 family)